MRDVRALTLKVTTKVGVGDGCVGIGAVGISGGDAGGEIVAEDVDEGFSFARRARLGAKRRRLDHGRVEVASQRGVRLGELARCV